MSRQLVFIEGAVGHVMRRGDERVLDAGRPPECVGCAELRELGPPRQRAHGAYFCPRSRRRFSTSWATSASKTSLGTALDGLAVTARTRSGSSFGLRSAVRRPFVS